MDSSLSPQVIDQILDELVPADVRGRPLRSPVDGLITESGQSIVTRMDFENVLMDIYGTTGSAGHKGATTTHDVVATVKWKKRSCRWAIPWTCERHGHPLFCLIGQLLTMDANEWVSWFIGVQTLVNNGCK
jgi:hypothetical protein